MSTLRQAALAIYEMHPEDQAWMLASLPSKSRLTVQGLLDELQELGFGGGLVATKSVSEVFKEPRPKTASERLFDADPVLLFHLLEREPTALLVQFLNANRWPWHEALVAGFPPQRQAAIRHAMPLSRPAKRRDEHLIDALAASLPLAKVATDPVPLDRSVSSGNLFSRARCLSLRTFHKIFRKAT